MRSLYDAAGGDDGLLRLAEAWHSRVLADEVVSHAFSHGFGPDHTRRLAAYWAEALGGPAAYTNDFGDETSVVRIHSGNGLHDEMDRRAIACFDLALEDAGLASEDSVRQALHDYFAWATTTSMAAYPESPDDVPTGLTVPRWSWPGLQPSVGAKDPAEAPTDPVLTPRLALTPVGLDDVDDLLVLYGDPLVARWTGPWTPAAVEAWAADMATRWRLDGVGKWMARDPSDGSLVGRGGFTRFDLDGETVLELGWAVRDARTGRGLATELGRAAIAWAGTFYPNLPVVGFTEVHNLASRAVMERLGMRLAGTIQRGGLIEGKTGVHPDAPFALYRL